MHIASTGRVSSFSAIGKDCSFLNGSSISADWYYILSVELTGSHGDIAMSISREDRVHSLLSCLLTPSFLPTLPSP